MFRPTLLLIKARLKHHHQKVFFRADPCILTHLPLCQFLRYIIQWGCLYKSKEPSAYTYHHLLVVTNFGLAEAQTFDLQGHMSLNSAKMYTPAFLSMLTDMMPIPIDVDIVFHP
jgi:hypothetical protein